MRFGTAPAQHHAWVGTCQPLREVRDPRLGERVNGTGSCGGSAEGVRRPTTSRARTCAPPRWYAERIDVDYNGWWMCLIPTDLVREIGLSLPVLVGDASGCAPAGGVLHGLPARRGRAGTCRGGRRADTIDWPPRARNRWLAALLYSPYSKGGDLPEDRC
ncbi:hypothetical protein QJS66_22845 [Kocuria rhizophila]|nr:hypothetical protein QJS66_22845 [Kocuria rhizophila]